MFYLLSVAFAGSPSLHDELIGRFHAHFSDHPAADGPACLTGLVRDLKENWSLFTPAERAEMTAILAPWTHDLLAPVEPTPPPPPGTRPTDTCLGQYGANRITGDHFSVEWDNGANESTAREFLEALEAAYTIEVEELGWRAHGRADDYLMLAYIQSGNYAGAYTTVTECGRDYVPYIVAYAGSFSGGSDWYETMALHEYNHASQFSYGFGAEFWIWEATATYIEEQVAPDNNWWSTYVTGYTSHPELAINAESQSDYEIFYHMYGMSTYFFYLDQYQAGPDAARQMWEYTAENGSYYDVDIEEMTDGIGLDFDGVVYPDFVARNASVEYDEQRYWASVEEAGSTNELPAEDAVSSRDEPGGYGQNYWRIKKGAGDGTSTLTVTVTSEESVDWLVELIEVDDSSTLRYELATGETEVTVSLPTFGDEDVLLAVSPTKHNNRNTYAYSWSAVLEEPDTVPGTDPGTGDDTGLPADGNDEGEGPFVKKGTTACGCSTGTDDGRAGLLLASLALVAAARRRPAGGDGRL